MARAFFVLSHLASSKLMFLKTYVVKNRTEELLSGHILNVHNKCCVEKHTKQQLNSMMTTLVLLTIIFLNVNHFYYTSKNLFIIYTFSILPHLLHFECLQGLFFLL